MGITPDPSFSGSAALRRPRSQLHAHLVPPPRVHRVSRARQGAPSPHESRPPRPGSRRSLPVQVAACSRPHARLRGTRGHPPGNASAPPKRAAGALQPHKIIQDGALKKKDQQHIGTAFLFGTEPRRCGHSRSDAGMKKLCGHTKAAAGSHPGGTPILSSVPQLRRVPP